MKLTIVVPECSDAWDEPMLREARLYAASDTTIDVVHLDPELDCGYDEVRAWAYDELRSGPELLRQIEGAVERGADAIFVTCFCDPAVDAARERVDVPVVGGFSPALLAAQSVADRCSIVTVSPEVARVIRRRARVIGMEGWISSIRSVDFDGPELSDDAFVFRRLREEMELAVLNDGAEALVLGCTGLLGVAGALQSALAEAGPFTPVIDPTAAAILSLEGMVRLGIRPSRRTYLGLPPDMYASSRG